MVNNIGKYKGSATVSQNFTNWGTEMAKMGSLYSPMSVNAGYDHIRWCCRVNVNERIKIKLLTSEVQNA